jgi:hypothetical protein
MSVNSAFVKNRAEEMGMDLWDSYIIPPYFPKDSILESEKTVSIIGGRGSGKTSLLRYLSYHSRFSLKRNVLVEDDLKFIGLYYKPDVNFLSSLRESDFDQRWWVSAFEHITSLYLIEDFINALLKINATKDREESFGGIDKITLEQISGYFDIPPNSISDLKTLVISSKQKFRVWVRNLDIEEQRLKLFSDMELLRNFIQLVIEQLPYLKNSSVAVFIDEYESLLDYQQKFFNGLIKNGEKPLVFHIASKLNGMRTRETLTTEIINEKADFRQIKLAADDEKSFELFAAELMFFRFFQYVKVDDSLIPIDSYALQDLNFLEYRKNSNEYKSRVLSAAKEVFPRRTVQEICKKVYESRKVAIQKNIEQGLKLHGSNIAVEEFLFPDKPEISIVVGALLNRQRSKPEEVLKIALEHAEHGNNRMNNLINENIYGCIYQIYSSSQEKNNQLYSGFSSIIKLSGLNIRHALDLFHEILVRQSKTHDISALPSIDPEEQVRAIKLVSAKAVEEVKSFSLIGNMLFNFVFTISSMFLAYHKRISQSEPEITHFYIKGDIDYELQTLLDEAEKWSVLVKYPHTKAKDKTASGFDYQLHPIYAPYFGISYRKERNTAIEAIDLKSIFMGSKSDRESIVRKISNRLNLTITDVDNEEFRLESYGL